MKKILWICSVLLAMVSCQEDYELNTDFAVPTELSSPASIQLNVSSPTPVVLSWSGGGAADGVPGGPANAQHQPQPVDEAEDRDGQVEGRQPVGAQPVGHKQGVGQDVAGQAQRAQHIQAHILEKAPLHSDPS